MVEKMLIYVGLETTRILRKVLGILVGCESLIKWGMKRRMCEL